MANTLSLNVTNTLSTNSGRGDHVTSSVRSRQVEHEQEASSSSARRRRWENTPGIRVTLNSLDQDEQVDHYQRLNYQGRRLTSSSEVESVIESHLHAQLSGQTPLTRQVNRYALEHVIKQMSGELPSSNSPGQLLNERV